MPNYKKVYSQISDQALLEVLISYKEVDQEALKIAILEAEKRGLKNIIDLIIQQEKESKLEKEAFQEKMADLYQKEAYKNFIEVPSDPMCIVNFELALKTHHISFYRHEGFEFDQGLNRYYIPKEDIHIANQLLEMEINQVLAREDNEIEESSKTTEKNFTVRILALIIVCVFILGIFYYLW